MVGSQRDIRRLTLQMLYQLDARGGDDHTDICESLWRAAQDPKGQFAGTWSIETLPSQEDHRRAFDIAQKAWNERSEPDRIATELAPDWPTHRQPTVDRNVIRLCWYEMSSGLVPPKAAVNEAIDLAKEFGTDRSGAFLNGVLDKMLKRVLNEENNEEAQETTDEDGQPTNEVGDNSDAQHTEFWISD